VIGSLAYKIARVTGKRSAAQETAVDALLHALVPPQYLKNPRYPGDKEGDPK
jgi:hypothetical protein